jgi:hypothetical protein
MLQPILLMLPWLEMVLRSRVPLRRGPPPRSPAVTAAERRP